MEDANTAEETNQSEVRRLRKQVCKLQNEIKERTMNYLTQLANLKSRKEPIIMYKYTPASSPGLARLQQREASSPCPENALPYLSNKVQSLNADYKRDKVTASNLYELEAQNKVLKDELKNLKSTLKEMSAKHETLINNCKEWKDKCSVATKKEEAASLNLKETIKQKDEEISKLRSKNAELQQSFRLLNIDLTNDVEKYKTLRLQLQKQVLQLSNQVESLKRNAQQSNAQHESLVAKIQTNQISNNIQGLEAELAKIRETHQTQMASLQQQHLNKVKELQGTLTSKTSKIDSLNKTIIKLKQESSQRKMIQDDAPEIVAQLQSQIRDLMQRVDQVNNQSKNQKNNYQGIIRELTQELDKLKGANIQLRESLRQSMANADTQELEKMKTKNQGLKRKVVELKQEREAQSSSLKKMEARLVETENQLKWQTQEFETEVARLRQTHSAELNSLEQSFLIQLKDLQTKLNLKTNKIDALNKTIIKLKQESSQREMIRDDAPQIVAELQSQVRDLVQRMDEVNQQSQSLKTNYQGRIRELIQQLQRLKGTNAQLRESVRQSMANPDNQQLEKMKTRNQGLKKKVVQLKQEREVQASALRKLENQLKFQTQELTIKIQQLEAQTVRMQMAHESEMDALRQSHIVQVKELNGKLALKTSKVDSLNKIIIKLKQESSEREMIRDDAPEIVAELQSQVRDLVQRMDEVNNESKNQKTHYEGTIRELTQQLEGLKSANAQLRDSLKQSVADADHEQLENIKVKNQGLKKKVLQLKQEREALFSSLKKMEAILSEVEAEYQKQKEASQKQLKTKIQTLQKENSQVLTQLAQYKKLVQSKDTQITALEDRLMQEEQTHVEAQSEQLHRLRQLNNILQQQIREYNSRSPSPTTPQKSSEQKSKSKDSDIKQKRKFQEQIQARISEYTERNDALNKEVLELGERLNKEKLINQELKSKLIKQKKEAEADKTLILNLQAEIKELNVQRTQARFKLNQAQAKLQKHDHNKNETSKNHKQQMATLQNSLRQKQKEVDQLTSKVQDLEKQLTDMQMASHQAKAQNQTTVSQLKQIVEGLKSDNKQLSDGYSSQKVQLNTLRSQLEVMQIQVQNLQINKKIQSATALRITKSPVSSRYIQGGNGQQHKQQQQQSKSNSVETQTDFSLQTLKHMEVTLEEITHQKESNQKLLASLRETISELNDSKTKQLKANDTLRSQVSGLQALVEAQKLEHIRAENVHVAEYEQLKRRIVLFKENYSTVVWPQILKKLQQLQKTVQTNSEKLALQEQKYKAIQKSKASNEQRWQTTMSDLQAEHKTSLATMQEKLKFEEAARKSAQTRLSGSQVQAIGLLSKVKELEDEKLGLAQQVSTLRLQNISAADNLHGEQLGHRHQMEAIVHESERLKAKLREAEDKIQLLTYSEASLKSEIHRSSQMITYINEELEGMSERLLRAQTSVLLTQGEIQRLTIGNDALKTTHQIKMSSLKEQHRLELFAKEEQYRATTQNIKDLVASLQAELRQTRNDRDVQLAGLKASYDNRVAALKDLARCEPVVSFAEKIKPAQSLRKLSTTVQKYQSKRSMQSLEEDQSGSASRNSPNYKRVFNDTPYIMSTPNKIIPVVKQTLVNSILVPGQIISPSKLKSELDDILNILQKQQQPPDSEQLVRVASRLKKWCVDASERLDSRHSSNRKATSCANINDEVIRNDYNLVSSQNRILNQIEEIQNFKKDKISELQAFKAQYETKLAETTRLALEFRKMYEEKDAVAKALNQKNRELQLQIEAMTKAQTASKPSSAQSLLEAPAQQLSAEIQALKGEINRLKTENDFINRRGARYEKAVHNYETSKRAILKEYEAMKLRIEVQATELRKTREDLLKLSIENHKMKQRSNAEFTKVTDSLLNFISRKNSDHAEKMQKLEKQLETHTQKSKGAESVLEMRENELSQYKNMCENLKKSMFVRKNTPNPNIDDDSDMFQHFDEASKKEHESLQQEINKLRQAAKDKDSSILKLERDIAKLRTENLSLHVNYKNLSDNFDKDRLRSITNIQELSRLNQSKDKKLVYLTQELSLQAKKHEKEFDEFIQSYVKNAFRNTHQGRDRRNSMSNRDIVLKIEGQLRSKNALIKQLTQQLFEIYQLLPQTEADTLFEPESEQELLGIVEDVLQFCKVYHQRQQTMAQRRQRKDDIYVRIIQNMLGSLSYTEDEFEDLINSCCTNEAQLRQMETLRTKGVYTIRKLRTQRKNAVNQAVVNNVAKPQMTLSSSVPKIETAQPEQTRSQAQSGLSEQFYDIREATSEAAAAAGLAQRSNALIEELNKKLHDCEETLKEKVARVSTLQHDLTQAREALRKHEEKCQKEHTKKTPVILQKGRAE